MTALRPPEGIDVDAWRGRLTERSRPDCVPAWPPIATCCAMRCCRTPARRPLRPDIPRGRGRRRAKPAPTRPRASRPRRSTTSGWRRSSPWPRVPGARRRGARHVGPAGDLRPCVTTGAAFHHRRPLVAGSTTAMARAWAAMPDWFEVLPQALCGRSTTGAKAFPPRRTQSRRDLLRQRHRPDGVGTFELEAMAFHEGIPGHPAVAIASGDVDPGVPQALAQLGVRGGLGTLLGAALRRDGLSGGPIERLGMLSADSMRAGRLVVDTGLHALGWGRSRP